MVRNRWFLRVVVVFVACCATRAPAAQFVLFPKAGQLPSPDGRFIVRDADRGGSAADFVGTFHSLWLTEVATGRSRKLCDYLGVAAVAWSGDYVLITQYSGKKSARALLFSTTSDDGIMIDAASLAPSLPAGLQATLRDNDHVFIESSRLEGSVFYLRVWGYGHHDPSGFAVNCQYSLQEGTVSCAKRSDSKQ